MVFLNPPPGVLGLRVKRGVGTCLPQNLIPTLTLYPRSFNHHSIMHEPVMEISIITRPKLLQ